MGSMAEGSLTEFIDSIKAAGVEISNESELKERLAEAQRWQSHARTPQRTAMVRQQIYGLAMDINRAQRRGTISRREAQGLHRAVRNLRSQFRMYNRDGLSAREVHYLEYRANRVRARLRLERFDWNDRRW